ncbi:hypothetical protein ASF29_13320 [Rhizobium sp. Leaf262]|nr:hypothetical protein ASF29_13320 [Rhizobium sp. Leaf262]
MTACRRKDKLLSISFSALLQILLMMCVFCLVNDAYARDEASPTLPPIDGHLSILEGNMEPLAFSDMLMPENQARFRLVEGRGINRGYTTKPLWLKLDLPAVTDGRAILSFSPNFLDFVDVYVQPPGQGGGANTFEHYAFGDHRPLPVDGISSVAPSVRLDFKAGQSTLVYVHILNTNSFTQVNMRLDPVESLSLRQVAGGLVFGLWFGAMAALMLTQLVFYHFDPKARYLLLALSTLGVMLVYVANLGLSRVFLFPNNGPGNDVFLGVTAWGGFSASAMVYASILSLRSRARMLYPVYVLFTLIGLVGMGFALAGKNILFGPFGTVAGVLGALLTMIIGIRQMNVDGQASRLAAVAFTLVGLGASISMLQRFSMTRLPDWVFYAYGLSALIQTLLLTGAKAIRLRNAESLNKSLQMKALHQAQASEKAAVKLVEERTRELVVARQVAEDALKAETDSQLRQVRFLEVVSHQYRTPLASIRSNIDGIALSLGDGDGANKNRAERIRRAVTRLVEVLEINVARSRLQGPSFRPQMEQKRAGEIVEAALQRAHDLLNAPDIDRNVEPAAAETYLYVDADMLELAIVNLLENAVKYSANNGAGSINLSLVKRSDDIEISVEDHGVGIPAADLPHVFDNSIRGANVGHVEGSGLGLFLVAKVVDAHQGRVEVSSHEGQGTVIRIILPTLRV